MPQIKAKTLHQILLAICGIIVTVAGVWNLVSDHYNFRSSVSTRYSLSSLFLRLFHVLFGLILIGIALVGLKAPLEWFGLLKTYNGSGAYLIFTGVLTLGGASDFGAVGGIFVIVIGLLVFLYGFIKSNEEPAPYHAFIS